MEARIETNIQSQISNNPGIKRHIFIGVIAAVALFVLYAGILVLAQGTQHTLQQTRDIWYWLIVLMGGFGVQVGLLSFIRQGMKERRKALTGSVAASGGVSAGSMVACCVHHLSDILPFLGLTGIAAFAIKYQVVFFTAGAFSSAVGITTMLETIQKHHLCPVVGNWRWDMRKVKLATIALSVVILSVVIVRTALSR